MTQPAQIGADSAWRIADGVATVDLPSLSAIVDLAAPGRGLTCLSAFGQAIGGHILGVEFPPGASANQPAVVESYHRGGDLVVIYEQTETCPFRATIYWRTAGQVPPASGLAVDLIVSIQTSLLDANPRLQSISRIVGVRDLAFYRRLPDGAQAADDVLARPAAIDESGCVRLMISAADATYCEMIHPSDWRGLHVGRDSDGVELRWPLRVEACALRQDSGGAGERRGGLGLERRLRILEPGATLSVLSDKNVIPPYGVNGGGSGAPN